MRRSILIGLALALAAPAGAQAAGDVHAGESGRDRLDRRGAAAGPTAAQRSALARLDARASWNRFGAPRSLINRTGWLAEGLPGAPREAAREFVRRNAALYRLDPGGVAALEVVADHRLPGSDVHVVTFRQRFGGLPAVAGGLLAVTVRDGRVAYASASLGGGGELAGERRLTAQEAWLRAADAAGVRASAGGISVRGSRAGFGQLGVRGLTELQQVREVAVPLPGGGARRAFEANVVDNGRVPLAWTVLVDAETGAVLRRVDRLDSAADQPNWRYFTNNPPQSGAGTDRRIVGCFPAGATPAAPCTFDERQTSAATPQPWDVLGGAPLPTSTTNGNNADAALSAFSPLTPGPDRTVRPSSPTRDYFAPFTNAWQTSRCNPSNFAGGIVPATGPDTFGGTNANDVNAAVISLFANHNNMHDWAYDLGFTESAYNMQVDNFGKGGAGNDPELGDAQGGALAGGFPSYTGRDNANQITLQDGVAPITNMYLWQPVASAFYPPCVDGDFDMSVIGHEYTHAISNRMVGGPDDGLTSESDGQARAMGESFSDLTAVEYLHEHGYAPSDDENPFAVGAYVTGSKQKGIRNYGMNASPLNYSDVRGYDGSGNESPHDDGEIWSATHFDVRQAMIEAHGAGTAAQQLSCARGQTPVASCPGNRRWMQNIFDSYLLMADGEVTMVEARDAYLAADFARYGSQNQALAWAAFARRGLGEGAASPAAGETADTDNPDPVPSFASPLSTEEATVTFAPVDEGGRPVEAELFVGDYEANVTPVADTDPDTPLDATLPMMPGDYKFVARGAGRGAVRLTRTLAAGASVTIGDAMPLNRASAANGATIAGDGVNLGALIDDTEETNWAALGRDPDVEGTKVTVALAGGRQVVERVNVSALLRAADDSDDQEDPGGQNRFTALRQFSLQACTANCGSDAGFTTFYTSPADAFPGGVPRPLAPDMILRSFDVPDTAATHVRLVVESNQCTGSAIFTDPALENDPTSSSDCREGNPPLVAPTHDAVRAAELQVFSRDAGAAGGSGTGTGTTTPGTGTGTSGPGGGTPEVCASTAGFVSARAVPRGRGLRFAFTRRVDNPVTIDVFRQSSGRRVLDNRLVKRFRGRSRSFTWRGRSGLGEGLYFARFRVRTAAGRTDFRRTALRRRGSRFASRPDFYRRASCGLLTSYKLSSAAFGGRGTQALGIAFRLGQRARVQVTVLRGRRVVRRFAARTYRADQGVRLRIGAANLRRGDHRVRLRAVAGSRRVTAVLVARRL